MNHPNHSMLHRPLLRRGLTVRVTNTRAVHATHHTHNTLVTALCRLHEEAVRDPQITELDR